MITSIANVKNPRARPKKQARAVRNPLAPHPAASAPTELHLKPGGKRKRRIATPHCSGFSAKKVRTLFRNRHKFAKNSESPEKGERIAECGGRGGIPPQTPPAAPPASLLAFLGISDTKAKGARGEKTRARSRRSRILTGFVIFIANTDRNHRSGSKRPTSASTEPVTRPERLSVRLSHLPPSLCCDRGVLRRTDIRRARTIFGEKKRKSTASRPSAWREAKRCVLCTACAQIFLLDFKRKW